MDKKPFQAQADAAQAALANQKAALETNGLNLERVAATLAAAGGVLSYLTIRDDSVAAGMSGTSAPDLARHLSCPLDAPPFRGLQRRG